MRKINLILAMLIFVGSSAVACYKVTAENMAETNIVAMLDK